MEANLLLLPTWLLLLVVSAAYHLVRRHRAGQAVRPAGALWGWISVVAGAAGLAGVVAVFGEYGDEYGKRLLLEPTERNAGLSAIYVMGSDGSGKRRISPVPPPALRPVWSPDGRHLAYEASGRSGGAYVVSADGTGALRLAPNYAPLCDLSPTWSPDGSRIAFVRPGSGGLGISVVNADGTGERQVASGVYWSYGERAIAWSPDGARIAYSGWSDRIRGPQGGSMQGLWVADLRAVEEGRPPALLLGRSRDGLADFRNLTWLPDGSGVLLVGSLAGKQGLYEVDAEGATRLLAASDGAHWSAPTWSPDGRWIAVLGYQNQTSQLHLIGADGRHEATVLSAWIIRTPTWSPDSRRIAVAVNGPERRWGIRVADRDGSGETNLTPENGDSFDPAWSPNGDQIAFVHSSSDSRWLWRIPLACGFLGPLALWCGVISVRRGRARAAGPVGIALALVPTAFLCASCCRFVLLILAGLAMGG